MIWNEAMECMPRLEMEKLQGQRLRQTVARVYERVPFYRQAFDAAGVVPATVETAADLPRLPFTRKSALRDHYPFGLFAVPSNEVVRIHASTGTTGKPTVVGYTRTDLQTWAELCARSLALAGAVPGQVFQNAYGYGLFTGGLGMHYGGEAMGLIVIPASVGQTARQILLLQDFGSQILACTPSYALALADALNERNIDRKALALRSVILGAEPWTEEMRAEIQARLNVVAVDIYGLSEIMGPGVACECAEGRCGAHVFEDHFIVEVVDPDSEEVLPEATEGELVFTTLTKEALPLIRYRTGDIASIRRERCPCGRALARMSRIVGRTDDMLIIRGVNVFPSQIEAALLGVEELAPHHQLIVTRDGRLDEVEVRAEVTREFSQRVGEDLFDESKHAVCPPLEVLKTKLKDRLRESLGLFVCVTLLPPNGLPRSDGGKTCRVLDQRVNLKREPAKHLL
jgi:phenylacetate-CoA ligase